MYTAPKYYYTEYKHCTDVITVVNNDYLRNYGYYTISCNYDQNDLHYQMELPNDRLNIIINEQDFLAFVKPNAIIRLFYPWDPWLTMLKEKLPRVSFELIKLGEFDSEIYIVDKFIRTKSAKLNIE
jgi:hypothetical protein